MYYMNTNPELLGKNKFKTSKTITSKALFKKELYNIVDEISKLNDLYSYYEPDWRSKKDARTLVSEIFNFCMNELQYKELKVPKKLKKIADLFGTSNNGIKNGISFLSIDVELIQEEYDVYFDEEYKDADSLKILNNFPYFQTYTATCEPASCVCYSILYFNENEELDIYIPTYGNTIFVPIGITPANGLDTDFGEELRQFFADLASEHKNPVTAFEGRDISDISVFGMERVLAFNEYKSKYGIKKVRHNTRVPEEDYEFEGLMTDFFLVSKRRVREDIASNII